MVDFFNEARLFAVDSKHVTTCLKKREKEKKKKEEISMGRIRKLL